VVVSFCRAQRQPLMSSSTPCPSPHALPSHTSWFLNTKLVLLSPFVPTSARRGKRALVGEVCVSEGGGGGTVPPPRTHTSPLLFFFYTFWCCARGAFPPPLFFFLCFGSFLFISFVYSGGKHFYILSLIWKIDQYLVKMCFSPLLFCRISITGSAFFFLYCLA
jgi:hypothetical protein